MGVSGRSGGRVGCRRVSDRLRLGEKHRRFQRQSAYQFRAGRLGRVPGPVRPDGSVASAFNPDETDYPEQYEDISYGLGEIVSRTAFFGPTVPTTAWVPADDSLGTGWTQPSFDDSAWLAGTTGVGYDLGGVEEPDIVPSVTARWTADDLLVQYADGQAIAEWVDAASDCVATAVGSPTLAAGAINGHAAVRFDPSDGNDQLRVGATDNPASGAENFSFAVVFRSDHGGITSNTRAQWYDGAGLIDDEIGGVTSDWGLSLLGDGRVAAGIGGPDAVTYSPA